MSKLVKSEDIVKSVVGEEGYETLNKAITKINTRSIIDITELHSSLKIIPKVIMSFLMLHAKTMKPGSSKKVKLPWADNCNILLNKKDQDVYAGYIDKNGKIEHEFDYCSIPQLAAHILSYFEMYDEVNENDEDVSDYKKIDKKINTLLILLTSNLLGEKILAGEEVVNDKPKSESLEMEKAEPSQKKSKKSEFVASLKKATSNISPKMPTPPKPGVKVGGNQGITKQGVHNDKTASTDMPGHDLKTHVPNPDLKISNQAKSMFKMPKLPKLAASESDTIIDSEPTKRISQITITKSEYNSQCMDCGSRLSQCQCFNGLSKPTVIDRNDKIELKFNSDWDAESVLSLVRSINAKKGQ